MPSNVITITIRNTQFNKQPANRIYPRCTSRGKAKAKYDYNLPGGEDESNNKAVKKRECYM